MPYVGGPDDTKVNRLIVTNSATPVHAPVSIVPSAAPTGTQAAGDVYLDSTTKSLLVSDGTSFNRAAGLLVPKTAVATLTAADNGKTCVFSTAAGYTYTLPTCQAGLQFRFVIQTTITSSAAKVITASGSEFLVGSILQIPDSAAQAVYRAADGTTIRAISMNGGTTGGFSGDWWEVVGISATQWVIWGSSLATGTEATPFATS